MEKLLVLLVVLFPMISLGQTSCDSIYRFADKMPVYRAGNEGLFKDIRSINFVKPCKPGDLRQIMWTIDALGVVIDIEVAGPEEKCRPSIIEQLKKTRDHWTGGEHHGKSVCVKVGMVIKSHTD